MAKYLDAIIGKGDSVLRDDNEKKTGGKRAPFFSPTNNSGSLHWRFFLLVKLQRQVRLLVSILLIS